MCGIFGYKGSSDAANIVLSGLKKLDYRGYDSWGIALNFGHKIFLKKDVGKISDIKKIDLPFGNISVGHTRWATTGSVSQINAHPHFSTDKSFALVQNGIVENFEELKSDLKKRGYQFKSETDTEVIVRLIESQKNKNLINAIRSAFLQLKGRNTIAVLDSKNNQIIALRNGSPLIIGTNQNDFYLSSDTLSLSGFATKYIDLDNFDMVVINNKINFFNSRTGHKINKKLKDLEISNFSSELGSYDHYMIKEIMESPKVIQNIVNSDPKNVFRLAQAIKKSKTVYLIGSGTAGNAAAQTAYYLKKYAQVSAISLVGSDAKDYYQLFSSKDLIIAPSQSGETSDVLEVLEFAKTKGVKIASLVNMPGSSMSRLSNFKFSSNSGPEICVMSTKVFVAQIVWGYLIAKTVAGDYYQAIKELQKLSESVQKYLTDPKNINQIKKTADLLLNTHDIFLLGKGQNFQIAKEGMIKLIEGTYKHAHAIPAGDLKHYAITLIEKNVFVLVLLSPDDLSDLNSAINEIRSRGGTIIGLFNQKQNNFDYCLQTPKLAETGAIFNIIPLQLLAYYLAVKLGNNVDKPRNIAKSVTVN
ncbi:MAG: glutamine--fructose-6-phosphate transaminase (isomerizing) [Candidatus Shapirobacteria bacterium]|jgi:glucosamine--fructose-6-phosphate aminotransferase (isomerizing)